jgi:hypothetical protein
VTEQKRRWTAASLVLFGHALIILLIDQLVRDNPVSPIETRRSMLFFVRPRQMAGRAPREGAIKPDESARLSLLPVPLPAIPPIDVQDEPRAKAPAINWREEGNRAANNAIAAQEAADALKFSEGSKRPRKKCVKPTLPQWRKETSKYGIAGGLPYMRFHNDRCILVLLFVGCGFGADPKAESHLFDNMQNYPNDSSVPDLDECEEQ